MLLVRAPETRCTAEGKTARWARFLRRSSSKGTTINHQSSIFGGKLKRRKFRCVACTVAEMHFSPSDHRANLKKASVSHYVVAFRWRWCTRFAILPSDFRRRVCGAYVCLVVMRGRAWNTLTHVPVYAIPADTKCICIFYFLHV